MIAILRFGIAFGLTWLGLPPAADATAATIGTGPARRQETKAEIELPELLRKAAAYCRKLEGSVLDFIAIEEIEEIIDTTLDGTPSAKVVTDWREAPFAREMSVRPSAFKNAMVYDYQCIRSQGAIRETRTLLKINGVEVNEPNAPLRTMSMVYRNALLSPLNLLSAQAQEWYDYKVARRGRLDKRPVVIVEVTPKPEAAVPLCQSGRAWFDAETSDILKIEWTQMPTTRLEAFAKRAARAGGPLRLSMRAEFSAEKNGLRFPSRLWVQEAYIRKSGRVYQHSVTNAVFKDFKFFTVETAVDER